MRNKLLTSVIDHMCSPSSTGLAIDSFSKKNGVRVSALLLKDYMYHLDGQITRFALKKLHALVDIPSTI